jgi:hypothetical protein
MTTSSVTVVGVEYEGKAVRSSIAVGSTQMSRSVNSTLFRDRNSVFW